MPILCLCKRIGLWPEEIGGTWYRADRVKTVPSWGDVRSDLRDTNHSSFSMQTSRGGVKKPVDTSVINSNTNASTDFVCLLLHFLTTLWSLIVYHQESAFLGQTEVFFSFSFYWQTSHNHQLFEGSSDQGTRIASTTFNSAADLICSGQSSAVCSWHIKCVNRALLISREIIFSS